MGTTRENARLGGAERTKGLNSEKNARAAVISMRGRTVGIVGARGINNYGGYERMLADFVPRLVQKGYDVRCSCEKPTSGQHITDDKGATLDFFALKPPSNYVLRKAFELLYDFFFVCKYALICDVVYVLGIYGGVALLVPRVLGKEVIVNTDGLEWKRAKYSIVERGIIVLYFAVSLNLATKIVVDNQELKRFIGERHHSKISYIPYGVEHQRPQPWDAAKLGHYISEKPGGGAIEPGKYWLLVSRLEPENNIDLIVKGFVEANPKYPLLVVGDFTSRRFKNQVHEEASNGSPATIHFLGAIYDLEILGMLRQHCLAYIHGHSVGGTNPSLLAAMMAKNLIMAHDNPFNKEVCDRFAHYFSTSADVSDLIASIERDPDGYSQLRWNAYERTAAYSWERVAEEYHQLFKGYSEVARGRVETEAHVTQNEQPALFRQEE
jgi:rhamnosyltransferase